METPKPMLQEEWQEFCSMTLHGPPPWETLRRIYTTLDILFEANNSLRPRLARAEEKAERLGKKAKGRRKQIRGLQRALATRDKHIVDLNRAFAENTKLAERVLNMRSAVLGAVEKDEKARNLLRSCLGAFEALKACGGDKHLAGFERVYANVKRELGMEG